MNLNTQQIQKIQASSSCASCVPAIQDPKKQKKPLIDTDKLANNFFTEYYKNVSNHGWTNAMYLMSNNCSIICKDKKFANPYEFLHHLFSELVKRANYDNIKSKWVVVDDIMIMTVFGQIQFVFFDNSTGSALPFAETFVIKLENGEAKCCSLVLDF
jgi:hypothetical protein